MCGLFNISVTNRKNQEIFLKKIVNDLFLECFSRGKDSAGVMINDGENIQILKKNLPANDFIKTTEYKNYIDSILKNNNNSFISISGHARMMTHGDMSFNENNQPIYQDNISVIHNGIILDKDKNYSKSDTYKLAEILNKIISDDNYISFKTNFEKIKGQASNIFYRTSNEGVFFSTNCGSLYYFTNQNHSLIVVASEEKYLNNINNKFFSSKKNQINKCEKNTLYYFDIHGLKVFSDKKVFNVNKKNLKILDFHSLKLDRINKVERCSKCILPKTFPGIYFNNLGICNFCINHKIFKPYGQNNLIKKLNEKIHNKKDKRVLVGLSGGRDSCYAIQKIHEMGFEVVAYTYDWGLITDVARRNISNLVSKLKIDHILISANIREKRHFVKKNIEAWIKKPSIGMVPIFMAGDKLYFYYFNKILKDMDLGAALVCGNQYEKTGFKSAFMGLNNSKTGKNWRPYDANLIKKIKYFCYLTKEIILNPSYLNFSLIDNAKAFASSFLMKHNLIWVYDYLDWNEKEIDEFLLHSMEWESDNLNHSSWRIGDGTSFFYNYIYYNVCGFSEHDTFLSNCIRDNKISRVAALEECKKRNVVNQEALINYSKIIGFDLGDAINSIDKMKTLY